MAQYNKRDLDEVALAEAYLSGLPIIEVARLFGCSDGPVYRIARQFGILRAPGELQRIRHPSRQVLESRGRIEARRVWEKAYGPIPKGSHIHHKDFNPTNNRLDNLELLTASAHSKLHNAERNSRRVYKVDWKLIREDATCEVCHRVYQKRRDRHNQRTCSVKCGRILRSGTVIDRNKRRREREGVGKIIGIVGTRRRDSWQDYLQVLHVFNTVHEEGCFICSGGCKQGGDRFAKRIAKDYNIPYIEYPADWDRYGKVAGFIRNTDIAKKSDVLIARVHPDRTGGTEDTIEKFVEFHGPDNLLLVEDKDVK